MTPERVTAILEAYGASPARWPEAERDAMLALMSEQPDLFAKAQAGEAALDALLEESVAQPSDLLEARLMRSLPRPAPVSRGWSWRAPAAMAAAVLLAVSIGFGSGLVGAPVSDPQGIEDLYADAYYSYGMDWSSYYSEGSDG